MRFRHGKSGGFWALAMFGDGSPEQQRAGNSRQVCATRNHRDSPIRLEDGRDVVSLAQSDFHSNESAITKKIRRLTGDGAVGIESVTAAIQRQMRIMLPHIARQ